LLLLARSLGNGVFVFTFGIGQLLVELLVFKLFGKFLLLVQQYFKQVCKHLDTFFYLSLDQIEHTFCEVFVQGHALACKVVIRRPLKAEIRLVVVLVLESQLSDLEQSISRVIVLLWEFGGLFEMEDCFFAFGNLVLDPFGQQFADVEMRFHF
jgi:hypothetical protein